MARKLGNAVAVGLAGKLFGAVFGALGTVLVLSEAGELLPAVRAARAGNDPLAKALQPRHSDGQRGLRRQRPGATDWAGLGTLAIALFLMLLLLYIVWRVVRMVL